ncbi:MAG: sigma-70 family RNA polymerase sigma factor [Deltaproteobacteria bacterium]|nr:sigma-70 family RNA polymerase sigma factor [Deltaproteobacteria bacterium]
MGHYEASPRTSDAELLEASRRGEHAAFGALVGRYQRVVSAVSYSRTRDRALGEDVAQETFLAAWRQLHQLREPGRLRSWLCGIARNLAGKATRRTRDVVTAEGELEITARDNPFEAVCEAQAERVVGDALSRVPETYRDVLVLYYQEQLSAREISETLGISEAAALQRLSRGRQCLAKGVTSLVEKSLRRPRRDLVAAVVAAIPALPMIVPSRAEASTKSSSSHGGSMFKLAIAAAAFVATGTTAVIVYKSDSTAKAAVTEAPTINVAKAPERPKQAPRAPAILPKLQLEEDPPLPPGAIMAPPPDVVPSIDARTYKRLKLDVGPSRGPKTAPVTIVMFTDLQCKYCGIAHGTIDQLMDEYPTKLRLVIKQMPVHKTAELAAEAALAAEAQGKFWELDELMIANHEDLSKDAILGLAKQGGLDVARLKSDLENQTYRAALDADKAAANELEIRGTPSFVINGRKVVGALPIEAIRATIEASLLDDKK